MKLFDSHAHYNDERFEKEFDGGADAAVKLSIDRGVIGFINAATDIKSSHESIALAEKYPEFYAAVGYHPTDCQYLREDLIVQSLAEIEKLCSHPKVVAIGEIGLDYHYDDTDKTRQLLFLERQLDMAEKLSLPVIIHDRDAHGDCLEAVKRHPKVTGVFHSFSGSAEMAKELLALGWYVSFGGPVSYKNAKKVKEAAAAVPLDRILIETDAPYLPPVPHRGEINYSALMFDTLSALADAMGQSEETVAKATVENTQRLFDITL